jgi:hypothetical protein
MYRQQLSRLVIAGSMTAALAQGLPTGPWAEVLEVCIFPQSDEDGDGVPCRDDCDDTDPSVGECPRVLCSDLAGWWRLDGDAVDMISGNEAALLPDSPNGPGFVSSGVSGPAASLDGIDDFIDADNPPAFQLSEFTVEAWIWFNALSHPPGMNLGEAPQGDMSIVDKMAPAGPNSNGWRLMKQDDNRFWLCLGAGPGENGCLPGSNLTVRSQTSAALSQWFHVAAVKSSSEIAIFVNGVEEAREVLGPAFNDDTANLLIGANALEGARLNGYIDEVGIFNRALAPLEIRGVFFGAGVEKCADTDGDGVLDWDDYCPRWNTAVQSDRDGNGIGDECECGDQNGDGTVDVNDILAINAAIFDPSQVTDLCDTNDDQLCDVQDILGANGKIFGAEAYCSRYPSP